MSRSIASCLLAHTGMPPRYLAHNEILYSNAEFRGESDLSVHILSPSLMASFFGIAEAIYDSHFMHDGVDLDLAVCRAFKAQDTAM